MLELMDTYSGGWNLLFISFCECISISYFYGKLIMYQSMLLRALESELIPCHRKVTYRQHDDGLRHIQLFELSLINTPRLIHVHVIQCSTLQLFLCNKQASQIN